MYNYDWIISFNPSRNVFCYSQNEKKEKRTVASKIDHYVRPRVIFCHPKDDDTDDNVEDIDVRIDVINDEIDSGSPLFWSLDVVVVEDTVTAT